MSGVRTAFALAGLGGNNAYGAGFLAAAQQVQRQRNDEAGGDTVQAERVRRGILPEVEFISCTSGAIATTATYLRGGDLHLELEERIAAVERSVGLPRTPWAAPWMAPAVALFTGVPGVFGPAVRAFSEHLQQRMSGFYDQRSGSYGVIPSTLDELLDLWLPARAFVPLLSDGFFEQTAATLNDPAHGVGVALNSFQPKTGVEHLYVNEAGMRLIHDHHNRKAAYGRSHGRTVYQPITPQGLRAALWLFYYGFPPGGAAENQHVDGAYCRSIILDELTFADRIYAVKPINHRWIGRMPQNLLEVQDMQTELWMSVSYREQARLIDTINKLYETGRLAPPTEIAAAEPAEPVEPAAEKRYHLIDLVPVEIGLQRGFFTYFVEDRTVFEEAYAQAMDELLSREETAVAPRALA
jgi:hypothetical protein